MRVAFERQLVWLPIGSIVPSRQVSAATRRTVRYRRIAASINEVGVIEPLVVAPCKSGGDSHRLLDGVIRYDILSELAEQQVRCLLARDDEAFTYNKRINPLSTIQEHFMIARALDRGVSEEKLAKALDFDIQVIKRRRSLLNGICSEVAELLEDRKVNPMIFELLRKMNPKRQINAAELMVAAGNLTSAYARALLASTKQSDLAEPDRLKRISGLTAEQMAKMERESESLHRDIKVAETSYRSDVLALVIATGYVSKVIGNGAIHKFLGQRYPKILEEFETIVAAIPPNQNG